MQPPRYVTSNANRPRPGWLSLANSLPRWSASSSCQNGLAFSTFRLDFPVHCHRCFGCENDSPGVPRPRLSVFFGETGRGSSSVNDRSTNPPCLSKGRKDEGGAPSDNLEPQNQAARIPNVVLVGETRKAGCHPVHLRQAGGYRRRDFDVQPAAHIHGEAGRTDPAAGNCAPTEQSMSEGFYA